MMIQAGYASEDKLASLNKKFDDQEARLAALASRLDKMTGRLSKLESAAKLAPPIEAAKSKTEVIYSGLVIDARDTGFRPCLKPEIFAKGELLYPGDYIDMKKAVRKGYVRYYRKIGRAQQSERVETHYGCSGCLPGHRQSGDRLLTRIGDYYIPQNIIRKNSVHKGRHKEVL